MNATIRRVIGLDVHPDLFTAAIVEGNDPATAKVTKLCDKLPMSRLESWIQLNARSSDTLVLEASGNSFYTAELLEKLGHRAVLLESFQASRIQKHYCVTDKTSAAAIARAYLSGLAITVWKPDPLTRARREALFAYKNAVKRATQIRARIRSYLNQHGVRVAQRLEVNSLDLILARKPWTALQEEVIRSHFADLAHAQEQRIRWKRRIAHSVITTPELLKLTRLLGVRDVVAFALGAIVGDVKRFATPKKLAAYAGLNPTVQQSGNSSRSGSIPGHGRGDLRSLLVQAAQAILRATDCPLKTWGRKLAYRKGTKVAVVAVARKLLVAVWYLLNGKFTALEELLPAARLKLKTMILETGWLAALTDQEARALLATVEKRFLAACGKTQTVENQPPAAV